MTSLLKKVGLVFDENKVKPYLKMSIQRLQLLINKKTNQVKVGKREIVRLLQEGKHEKARIRVEQVIRDDDTVSAYDILELHCELVAGRIRFLATQKECPQDMEQAVCTLIWAADRAEVAELSTVKDQFAKKFGGDFVRRADLNEDGCVNQKVIEKLSSDPPSGYMITEYIDQIAKEAGIEYTPPKHEPERRAHAAAAPSPAPAPAPERAPPAPHAAYEAPMPEQRRGSGGAAGPPSVDAWAVPSSQIPQAHPAAEPLPGVPYPGAATGGGGAFGGIPTAYPAHQPEHGGGQYAYPQPGGPQTGKGVGGEWGPPGGSGDPHDPPPPYSAPGFPAGGEEKKVEEGPRTPPPYVLDIPAAPTTTPVRTSATYDIPAAPGYEDPPTSRGDRDRSPSAPPQGRKDDDDDEDPRAPGGGDHLDDLAARLKNLHNF